MPLAYRFALFVHIAAQLAAIAASTLIHFFQHRVATAERAPEARRWIALIQRTSIAFPIALLLLVATGGYMVSQAWTWSVGWVDAGLVGVAFLFVNGIRFGKQGRATLDALERAGDVPLGSAGAARGRPMARATYANTGVATAVVFVMSLKPGMAGSLAALVVGAIAGQMVGARTLRVASATGSSEDALLDQGPETEPA